MLENEKYFDAEKMVDEALIAEPKFSLTGDFADLVAEKVSRKFAWQQYLREFLIYLGVFVGIGITIAASMLFRFEFNWQTWFDFLFSNVALIIGVYVISIFILFADRVLLRYFMFKSNLEMV